MVIGKQMQRAACRATMTPGVRRVELARNIGPTEGRGRQTITRAKKAGLVSIRNGRVYPTKFAKCAC